METQKITKHLVKIKWNGSEDTLIRERNGGEKVKVKPGQTVTVEKVHGEQTCNGYKDWEMVGPAGSEKVDKFPDGPKAKQPAKGKKSKAALSKEDVETPEKEED